VARRSSKRASGTGDDKEIPQDAVTEETAEGRSEEAESPAAEPVEDDAVADADTAETETTLQVEEPAEPVQDDASEPEDTAAQGPDDTPVEDSETLQAEAEAPDGIEDATEILEEASDAAPDEPPPVADTPPPPQTVVEKRGPGFVPLVIGGVVAAGIGYFASVSGLLARRRRLRHEYRDRRPLLPSSRRFLPPCRNRSQRSAPPRRPASIFPL
jgi:hypothetical protein